MRIFTSTLIGLAVLVSGFIGAGFSIAQYSLPVGIGCIIAFLFGCGANVINDYYDIERDRINHPERPLPSGGFGKEAARRLGLILLSFSAILSIFFLVYANYWAFFIVVIAILLQTSYEMKLKEEKVIGNIVISVQTALAFLLGGVIVGHAETTIFPAALAFFSIYGREIIKDIEDAKGDLRTNSLPRRIGAFKAGVIAAFFIILPVIISILPYYLRFFNLAYFAIIIIADIIFIGAIPSIFTNPARARKILKIGMLIALIAFVGGRIFSG